MDTPFVGVSLRVTTFPSFHTGLPCPARCSSFLPRSAIRFFFCQWTPFGICVRWCNESISQIHPLFFETRASTAQACRCVSASCGPGAGPPPETESTHILLPGHARHTIISLSTTTDLNDLLTRQTAAPLGGWDLFIPHGEEKQRLFSVHIRVSLHPFLFAWSVFFSLSECYPPRIPLSVRWWKGVPRIFIVLPRPQSGQGVDLRHRFRVLFSFAGMDWSFRCHQP